MKSPRTKWKGAMTSLSNIGSAGDSERCGPDIQLAKMHLTQAWIPILYDIPKWAGVELVLLRHLNTTLSKREIPGCNRDVRCKEISLQLKDNAPPFWARLWHVSGFPLCSCSKISRLQKQLGCTEQTAFQDNATWLHVITRAAQTGGHQCRLP